MKSFLEITGENGDTPTTSYLFSDSDRYFFDCGDGFQRFIKGRSNITFGKIKSIFITSLSWDCIGGLIGLFLTMAELNIKVRLYGPKGLHKLFTSSREFQYQLNVEIYEVDSTIIQTIKDDSFTFYTLPITNKNNKDDDNDEIKSIIDESKTPTLAYYGRNPQPIPTTIENDYEYEESSIVCYIGMTKDFKGKFYPEKAVALGVPKGISFKHLQDGKSVTNKDGVTITPDQVMDKSIKGTKFAIIRCPSIEYLPSLKSHLSMFTDIHIVNHIVPNEVLSNLNYIKFMEDINQQSTAAAINTKHIIVNNENCERVSGCQSSDNQILKLQKFIPSLFPMKQQSSEHDSLVKSIEFLNDSKILKDQINVFPCKETTNLILGPPQNAGDIEFLPLNNNNNGEGGVDSNENEGSSDNKSMEEFINTEQGQLFKKQLDQQVEQLESNPNKCCHPKILFTGTGSAIPSKYRNVTGNFITLADDQNILLDAGEGTFGQLYRFFGPIEVKKQLINLKMIWLSHLHADHHLGIPNICEKRQQYAQELGLKDNELEPLIIIGPEALIQWVNELSVIVNLKFIGIAINGNHSNQLVQTCKKLNIKSFSMVPVIHCNYAFGLVIEWNDGFKLTYSGDTRPCKFLSEMGKDSCVQIHEATFEDEKQMDAVSKRHSTVGEALEVGRLMNCKFSLLTHFSQRYPNLKMGTYKDTNYGLAIDLLQISPYQYPLVYKMIEPFSLLFENEAQKKLDKKSTQPTTTSKSKSTKTEDENNTIEKDAKRLEKYQNKYKDEVILPAYVYNIDSNSLTLIENTFDDLSSQPQFEDD
ncbi:hypothetical protein DDB_G0290623 [Dictyostelium discoideum AX4]|uniref:ribonuclease Z n=1 Tax=Dictyostelium discoideum TaxID=44689 RepID=Q54FR8_DICDI|nr:hypothetical protein DDB_G0290623 [Dictyostelium discoideum AX4]EAL62172.1 hypothetical protein DDB_G0290623 [Dictyostelium discoideum AX4]|eukprot:XP_635699.1 hypothetical protein DDB_G0290623 [Dictyostelium discoideum AX4]